MPILLAGCIILNPAGEILLVHRQTEDYDHWEIAGGKIEVGESADEAAKRELSEELGLKVRILNQLGEADFEDNGRIFHYTWFQAETNDEPRIMERALFSQLGYFASQTILAGEINLSEGAKRFADLLKTGEITL